jgi:uracil-DNA glycosylase
MKLMNGYIIIKLHMIQINIKSTITTVHPSPFSAHNGFFGCNVFKNINEYFIENNIDIIFDYKI